jgi:hypothetical protein
MDTMMVVVLVIALIGGYWSAHSMMAMSVVDWIMIAIGIYLLFGAYSFGGLSHAHKLALTAIGALIVGYEVRQLMSGW